MEGGKSEGRFMSSAHFLRQHVFMCLLGIAKSLDRAEQLLALSDDTYSGDTIWIELLHHEINVGHSFRCFLTYLMISDASSLVHVITSASASDAS